jgi:hypothetical protein
VSEIGGLHLKGASQLISGVERTQGMRHILTKATVTVAALLGGVVGWKAHSYWPPPGGYVMAEGPAIAEKLKSSADVACVESWSAGVAAADAHVAGGRDIPQPGWAECVRRAGVQRVHVMPDGQVALFMAGTWRLVVRPQDPVGNTCWSVGSHSCVTYVER